MEKERSSDEFDGDTRLLLQPSPTGHRIDLDRFSSWLQIASRQLRKLSRRHPILAAILKFYLPIASILLYFLVPILLPSYARLPPHYQQLEERCRDQNYKPGCANPQNVKVFISSILYDPDGQNAGGGWGERVIDLINLLGPENVFLSMYESDSGNAGKEALDKFKAKVPCHNEIHFAEHVPPDIFPAVKLPDGSERRKRLSLLAELRNRALKPLNYYVAGLGLVWYDRVLFLNDIAFNPMDGAHLLLNTNVGPDGKAHYLTACATDWYEPTKFYDLFALRDADGFSIRQKIFPLFTSRGSGTSASDIFWQKDAVRVKSCWSGMVAVEAKYVQNRESKPTRHNFEDLASWVIKPDAPHNVTAPVRFRYEPEPYFEACECCLFLADVSQVARDNNAIDQGVFMNPFVRVAYNEDVLSRLPSVKKWERLYTVWFKVQSWFTPATQNPYRTVIQGEKFTEEVWDGEKWQLVERTGRNGLFCGVREMMLLREKRTPSINFVNTKIPPGQKLKFRSLWGKTLPWSWKKQLASMPPEKKTAFLEDDWLA